MKVDIFSAVLGLILLMIAIEIQKGIMLMRNTSVKVPAVMKKSQIKNPITCAVETISIVGVLQ